MYYQYVIEDDDLLYFLKKKYNGVSFKPYLYTESPILCEHKAWYLIQLCCLNCNGVKWTLDDFCTECGSDEDMMHRLIGHTRWRYVLCL